MVTFIQLIFHWLAKAPVFVMYEVYDHLLYWWYRDKFSFYGWGIHLWTGKFGQGKTSVMVARAHKLCSQYPQLSILTNINLTNFPDYIKILPLNTAQDILNAPKDCLVLIDEIGTIFNSRDFSGGKNAVPKSLFQHLCQCRKRRMMILATVQRFNLLDKQIRDITATVSACTAFMRHPFSRAFTVRTYDIDEYEAHQANITYVPRALSCQVIIQSEQNRRLYDTSELVTNMLKKDYLSDDDIMKNRGEASEGFAGQTFDKKSQKKARKNVW